ncbi:MAG TPA: serine hydrolase [Ohtaekwangia sp.]|nr:serine hydrolase [Ohtaekwangia sp.]
MSDNNGCDILFSLLGEPIAVEQYVHSIGIKDMAIRNTEAEMHQTWDLQFKNWCTPHAMTKLLELFHTQNVLSKSSHDILWNMMAKNTTGTKRIRGHLPKGTIVADRTGTGAKDEGGVWSAVNNVGIIRLPDGNHIALSVFITNAKADHKDVEEVIARIARAVYDYYTPKEK